VEEEEKAGRPLFVTTGQQIHFGGTRQNSFYDKIKIFKRINVYNRFMKALKNIGASTLVLVLEYKIWTTYLVLSPIKKQKIIFDIG